jgi:sporulation-control protein spo0M
MPTEHAEGWDKYQKLILNELKNLKAGQERLSDEVVEFKSAQDSLTGTKEFVQELKKVATIGQYEKIYEDVSILTRFKNNALAIYITLQAIIGIAVWYITYKR